MNVIGRRISTIAVLSWLLVGSHATHASVARHMSVEEVTIQAPVIVLGRVSEIPEFAVEDQEHRRVIRHNRVHVDEYLKGDGQTELEVITLGGTFWASTNNGRE